MGSFDSLRYRDYRLFWAGAFLSNVGTWMQSIALSWYVLLLTHSPFWVSFVTFANFFPVVLSPLGGVYSDRLERKRILWVTQSVMMVDAAALAILAWTGHATLLLVMLLTFGQGLAFAFNGPTWMAFVPSLVPPEAMVNAIALNSAQFSLARVVGPAIAGPIIGRYANGPAIVFTVNAISFVAVLVALAFIRARSVPRRETRSVRDLLLGGLRYTWRSRQIRTMVVAIAVISFCAAPASSLLPVFADDVFHHGAGGFGRLAAALGLGSVAGALILGRMGRRVSGRMIAIAMAAVGAVLILFASIHVYVAGLGLMFAFGGVYLFLVSGSNSAIQLMVDEGMRGRVISIWMLAFGMLFPVGALVAGVVAEAFGAPIATAAGASICVVWGLSLLLRRPREGPAAELPEAA